MDNIKITMPLKKEYLLPIRLFTGGLCSEMGFDLEVTEDIKVATGEAVLILLGSGFDAVEITYTGEFAAQIMGIGKATKKFDNEFAELLIRELVSSFETLKDSDGGLVGIKLARSK